MGGTGGREVLWSVVAAGVWLCAAAGEYEIGGPLAGLKLPLWRTQHGEPAGYPGCLPERAAAQVDGEGNRPFTPQGMAPELELYPGSVEHWRTYWFKYCPVRGFFDAQSQVKNFLAKDLPGVQVERYASPVYWVPRHDEIVNTGKLLEPVPVVRCKVGSPVLKLDLGTLAEGLYAVRVVGAVPTKHLHAFLLPAFVGMRVNDGLKGEVSRHRIRIGYVDEFYSVAELYFHAPERRHYEAEVWLDEGSAVDLLVHNVSLDDVLAGTERRAVKTRMTLHSEESLRDLKHWALVGWQRARQDKQTRKPRDIPPLGREERLARDALIWNALPHPNCQGATVYGELPRAAKIAFGAPGASAEQIEKAHGKWEIACPRKGSYPFPAVDGIEKLLVNTKLNRIYSIHDLALGNPLPDPYPYKDDGSGLFFPDPDDTKAGHALWPIARAVQERPDWLLDIMNAGSVVWGVHRDRECARDAAVALCRFACQFPTMDPNRALVTPTTEAFFRNRALCRRRVTSNLTYGNFIRFLLPLVYYDRLFEFIRGNAELAESLGRFVPWVRSPDDVVKLLDVFLVQTMAKRVLRYNYYGDGRQPSYIAEIATVLGDRALTRPWMEWLFARAFYYPKPIAGIQELLVSNTDRDGRSPIGSRSYTLGDFSAGRIAETLAKYIEAGGDPRFDLRDTRRYPKAIVSTRFPIRMWTAGLWFPRIGSVTGPDKAYAHGFPSTIGFDTEQGWLWTRHPAFACILKHYRGRKLEADAEWEQIEQAAAKVARAPWLDNRSRVVPGWAAFLEAGTEHDDFRFRRSALLRVGTGAGHGHSDTLDLQFHAHGLPITIDAGQRGGYSEPGDRHSRVHNVVEVDGQNWLSHSWVQTLCDAEGARYLRAQASPLHGTTLFRRQLALVDVSEGSGSKPLTPEQCGPQPAGLPKDVVTPNSYVFDCFRVAGGRRHTYCFHANVNDPTGPQPTTNAAALAEGAPRAAEAVAWLGSLANQKVHGLAPARLEALFQLQKTRVTPGKIRGGCEKDYLGRAFDAEAPDKFLRLHLFGAEGALVMKGDLHCTQWEYFIPNLYVQRGGEKLESAFAAVLEPYAGKPFIAQTRLVAIPGNETDALRAVAIEVKTTNGHTDLCFADGRPEETRKAGAVEVAGEFACLSTDAAGLRQATLVGGTRLAGPGFRIETSRREWRGTVVRADYFAKKIHVDGAWPATRRERIVEIGAVDGGGKDGYVTGYTATAIEPAAGKAAITLLRGADYYLSRVKSVDAAKGIVVCRMSVPGSAGDLTGLDSGFVASNHRLTKFWRADVLPGDRPTQSYPFRLRGAPVREKDFAPEMTLHLWEFGVGDAVRMSTFMSLRRMGDGVYELEADVPCKLALRGKGIEISSDGKAFRDVPTTRRGDLAVLEVGGKLLGATGRLWLRVR